MNGTSSLIADINQLFILIEMNTIQLYAIVFDATTYLATCLVVCMQLRVN